MEEYIIYTTYYLEDISNGFSDGIHCNYIKKETINTNNIFKHRIKYDFKNDIFKQNIEYQKLFLLVQIQPNINGMRPDPNEWRKYEITTFTDINNEIFEIELGGYESKEKYYLSNDINYPTKNTSNNHLNFGEERVLLGNVSGNIKADVFTTEIYVDMGINQFNFSNNPTWDGSSVYVTEIGIYDKNYNLVAIGKMNNPMEKNNKISRKILFSIDF